MPTGSYFHERLSDPVDAVCSRRFWVPRGTAPDLSEDGYLVDPEGPHSIIRRMSAVPFEALAEVSVLGLLANGISKTTTLKQEPKRLEADARPNRSLVLQVDLASCGTDSLVCKSIFESKEFMSWKKGTSRLQLFLDGFDTCLKYVPNLVKLLCNRFASESRDRLSLRIACRTTEWPTDLESLLRELWPGEQDVQIFELAPLRRVDVFRYAEAAAPGRAEEFLKEVERLGASQFANRPITLRFLLELFRTGTALPERRADLYRDGCRALCDEYRHDLRRAKRPQQISTGLRFAVAGRLAAVIVFSRRTAIFASLSSLPTPDGDVRIDDLLGGNESYKREVVRDVSESAICETLETGLFRLVGPDRFGFSNETYAEFLAARYLFDHEVPTDEILKLILDASRKVVPQLRETAAWLAAFRPDVGKAILSSDAATLFRSDTPPR